MLFIVRFGGYFSDSADLIKKKKVEREGGIWKDHIHVT